MGNAIVEFNGICTHVTFDQFAPELPSYGRRIVLPNGNHFAIGHNPHLNGKTYGIPPIEQHVARLLVPALSTIAGPAAPFFLPLPGNAYLALLLNVTGIDSLPPVVGLKGATLQFVGAFGEMLTENSAWCLPHLSASLEVAPTPSPLITNKDSESVSAYFDMMVGPLSAVKTELGQAITHLNVTTVGPAQLLITPWDGAAPTLVTLPEGPEPPIVAVVNEPLEPEKDHEHDFLLHFVLTNDQWPPSFEPHKVFINAESACPPGSRFLPPEAGPGCSNSNLP